LVPVVELKGFRTPQQNPQMESPSNVPMEGTFKLNTLEGVMKWKIHHMDVKTTSLNGVIEEEVYIEQPQGFKVHGRKTYVCRLKKVLYGVKQAPRAWYSRINGYLQSLGFIKSDAGPNPYLLLVGKVCSKRVLPEREPSDGVSLQCSHGGHL
jgi:hypothetical protein